MGGKGGRFCCSRATPGGAFSLLENNSFFFFFFLSSPLGFPLTCSFPCMWPWDQKTDMPQTAVSSQKLVASTPSSNKASSLCKSLRSTAPQVRMDLPPPTSLFLVREDSASRAGPHSPLLYYSQQLQSDSLQDSWYSAALGKSNPTCVLASSCLHSTDRENFISLLEEEERRQHTCSTDLALLWWKLVHGKRACLHRFHKAMSHSSEISLRLIREVNGRGGFQHFLVWRSDFWTRCCLITMWTSTGEF